MNFMKFKHRLEKLSYHKLTFSMPTTHTSVHTISLKGPSGIILMLLIVATVFYILGYSTNGWHKDGEKQEGLWEECNCKKLQYDGWLPATQAMITIGLIGLLVSLILIIIYQYIHAANKNSVIIALVIIIFVSVLFMFIGFIIYGVEKKNPNWSYAMTVIGACATLAAGIVTIIQMIKSDVKLCF